MRLYGNMNYNIGKTIWKTPYFFRNMQLIRNLPVKLRNEQIKLLKFFRQVIMLLVML